MGNINITSILRIGVIGLGFLLALFAYRLLSRELQNQKEKKILERDPSINMIYAFMGFSIVLCLIGIVSEVIHERSGKDDSALESVIAEREGLKTKLGKKEETFSNKINDLTEAKGRLVDTNRLQAQEISKLEDKIVELAKKEMALNAQLFDSIRKEDISKNYILKSKYDDKSKEAKSLRAELDKKKLELSQEKLKTTDLNAQLLNSIRKEEDVQQSYVSKKKYGDVSEQVQTLKAEVKRLKDQLRNNTSQTKYPHPFIKSNRGTLNLGVPVDLLSDQLLTITLISTTTSLTPQSAKIAVLTESGNYPEPMNFQVNNPKKILVNNIKYSLVINSVGNDNKTAVFTFKR